MRPLLLVPIIVLSGLAVNAQQPHVIDSLFTVARGNAHDTLRCDALNKLSSVFGSRGQFDRADSLANAALDIAKRIGSVKWEAEATVHLHRYMMSRGQPREVLANREVLIDLAERSGEGRILGNCYTLIGNCYRRTSDLERALENYIIALGHFEKVGDQRGISSGYNNIAIIYANQKRLEDALKHFTLSTEVDRKMGNSYPMATGLMNQGICLMEMKRYSDALPKLDSALSIYERLQSVSGMSQVLHNTGITHYYMKDYGKAAKVLERALDMARETGKQGDLAGILIDLGEVKRWQGNLTEAKRFITEGLELALMTGNREFVSTGYQKLAQADSASGDYKSALKHWQLHTIYLDSILNATTTEKLAEMETRFETEKKEQEILVLNKENELKQQEIGRQKLVRNGFIIGFGIMLLFAGIFLLQRNRISKEKARSEELLLNILPHEVAQELKQKGSADARLIDEVTVLFTDFKGFTQLSETLSPQQLVADLNECFSAFDRICAKHGIEKIKTIGDAYMAAGGIPVPTASHAIDVVRAAMEMRDFIEEGKARKMAAGLPFFEIRIGIHTGPVVAGIVGIKKFQYDIWGDTVNTASRMESSGEAGKVNISEATYALVKDEFACEFRGEVEAKGKGKLGMYFVG